MNTMARMYRALYSRFDEARYKSSTEMFGLDPTASINTFSKGMRRQAAAILGLSCMPDYLFFDETFDGLDPVMRGLVKQVIYRDVVERNTTTIITSHALHELEDTCDQLALLHRGGIIFQSDVQDLKTSLFKVQTAFASPFTKEKFAGLNILSYTQMGSVCTFILRGDRSATEAHIRAMSPLVLDVLPLSLEEVFVHEMDALGYSFKDILT
jgi:ABC-2 type transport system ATP-binding protein